jgi:hypothetical protein
MSFPVATVGGASFSRRAKVTREEYANDQSKQLSGGSESQATFGSRFGSCGNQTRRAAGKSPIRPYRIHGGLVGLERNGRPRSKLHGTSGCFLPKAQCKVCASAARNAGL